ncbi:MAG: hypothetical protein FD123_1383 [Bacteroidetes bacterium]|nr:MAG: hypothetical protein FD123_1383 [Bacteroidota bacterium]
MLDFLRSDDFMNWVAIPLLIFIARMSDVSLATIRNIFISKGFRKIVPFIGFFEVLIWLIAMKQVMTYANNWFAYFAWAAGFSMGTLVGMRIEERLALGTQIIRIIVNNNSDEFIAAMRNAKHGVTTTDAQGAFGPVKMIFTVVQRKNVAEVIALIEKYNPSAFYSIEDVRTAEHGYFAQGGNSLSVVRRLFSGKSEK